MKQTVNLRKVNYLHEAKDYLFITTGLVLYAVGVNCFQLPYRIMSGGLAGAGALVYYATNFPQAYTYLIVNCFLLILAIKEMGWKFCVKTIYAVLGLTFLLEAFRNGMIQYGMLHPELARSAQGLPQIVPDDAFMSTILGAACEGIGLGIVFLSNGSTGGTDIVAAVINKYRDITLGQVIMLVDVVIISSSMLLPGSTISQLLYGFCTLIVTNILLDFVVDRGRQSVQFFIFSRKYEAIADAITATGRGVTVLQGEGWYTHTERKVIVVLAKKSESTNIFRIIQMADPGAFVSQCKAVGVFGEGFDRIKVRTKKHEMTRVSREEHSGDYTAFPDYMHIRPKKREKTTE